MIVRGLGDSSTLMQDTNGNVIDCSSPSNWFSSLIAGNQCFDVLMEKLIMGQSSQVQQPNLPAPTTTQQYTPTDTNLTAAQLAGQAPIDPFAQAAAGVAITQAQNQQFFSNLDAKLNPTTCTATWLPPYCNSTVGIWGAVGLGLVYLLGQILKGR